MVEGESKGAFRGVIGSVFLWFAVFMLSIIVLSFFKVAPPEILESVKYAISLLDRPNAGFNANFRNDPVTTVSDDAEVEEVVVESQPISNPLSPIVLPKRIVIDKIKVDAPVLNPRTTDSAGLDEALLSGVVRHPNSGTLLDDDSIFLFGHSSYIPTVRNSAYKIFNKLSDVHLGDEIKLYGDKSYYIYKVSKIEIVDAEKAFVKMGEGDKKLVISTCDSFGKKSDRFVVEALFVGSEVIN